MNSGRQFVWGIVRCDVRPWPELGRHGWVSDTRIERHRSNLAALCLRQTVRGRMCVMDTDEALVDVFDRFPRADHGCGSAVWASISYDLDLATSGNSAAGSVTGPRSSVSGPRAAAPG